MSEKAFIIPIFIPQAGCPHQCVFCNQETITGHTSFVNINQEQEKARETVREYLAFKHNKALKTELAFYGGNFLGLEASQIEWYINFARDLYRQGLIDALRFSTRPDTITGQSLSLLNKLPVSVIELGVQSMHNEVLRLSGRGHTVADTERAVALIKAHGFAIGLQMMPGLPGDTTERTLATGRRLTALKPGCVRIYPTVVLKNSPLARMYREGRYKPLELEAAVDVTAELYRLFRRHGIAVIRMGLQAADNLKQGETILAGPYHPAFGHLVISRLFRQTVEAALSVKLPDDIEIAAHAGQTSNLRGLSNANVKFWAGEYPHKRFHFVVNNALAKTQIMLNGEIKDIIG